MLPMDKALINQRRQPDGSIEDSFRREVRYALDLDVFSRDDQIIAEIQRLRKFMDWCEGKGEGYEAK